MPWECSRGSVNGHTLILDQRLLSKLQKNSKIYIKLKEAIVQSNDEYSVDEYI